MRPRLQDVVRLKVPLGLLDEFRQLQLDDCVDQIFDTQNHGLRLAMPGDDQTLPSTHGPDHGGG